MEDSSTQPHLQLATMSRWYVVSRSLHAIAKLGIADYMSFEPISVNTLAKVSGTKAELLERLLNFLSSYNIFKKENKGYSLTSLSKPLREDDPHSIKSVLCMVDDNWWEAFSNMDYCLKSDQSGFSSKHGVDFFTFLSNNPEKQINFDKGMAKLSTYDDKTIASAYPFDTLKHIIDMGGGRGGLGIAMAKLYPNLTITIFDTPSVIDLLNADNFPERVSLQSGDFLDSIPSSPAYIFKGVLHDFNDKDMEKILRNCYQQMPSSSKLFIAEQVLPEDDQPHPNKTMDIVMMVLLGGRQRSLKEWQNHIESFGFSYKNSYPTKSLFTLMEYGVNK